ncbi:MAG: hypothetical protein ABSE63_00925 [Thermoguttaceae bacterium]|jgi:hypothetical protein
MSRSNRVIQVGETGNGTQGRFSLPDGSTFAYTSRETRQEALKQAEDFADNLQSVIETRIGRRLLPTEGRGLKTRAPMDAHTAANQNSKWRDILEGPEKVQDTDPVAIQKRRLERYEQEQEEQADPKLYAIKADLRKAEEIAKDKADREAMLANEGYASALKIAKQQLFNARFNPNVSAQTISDLEGLVTYLGTGKADFSVAFDIGNQIKEQIKTEIGLVVAKTQTLAGQYENEVKELRKVFDLPEKVDVVVEPTSDSTQTQTV